MTGRDLITVALRQIGVIAPGDPLAANEAVDGLAALNRMLGSWSTESLLIYARVREAFPLVSGTGSYSMGLDTGDFDTARPQRIEAATILVSDVEYPLMILTQDEWVSIRQKGTESTIPTCLYPEGTFPLETLNLWPVPSAVNDLVLYSWKPLTAWASLDDDNTFPPGYEDALIQNLAIRLAPEYRKTVSPVLGSLALESKANIKRMNKRSDLLRVDNALMKQGGRFNIYTGDFQ